MKQGEFRTDLFYRLSILRLKLPPLRERLPDILPLAEGFLKQSLAELDVPFSEPVRKGLGLSQPTLLNYGWPGNIRELRYFIHRLCATMPDTLDAATMQDAVQQAARLAHANDAVLLSPACASMDMFKDYADRAHQFVEAVRELALDAGQQLEDGA